LTAFGYGGPNCHDDFPLIVPGTEGRLKRLLELIDHGVGQLVHKLRLFSQGNVECGDPIGQIEHGPQKFEINSPFVLML